MPFVDQNQDQDHDPQFKPRVDPVSSPEASTAVPPALANALSAAAGDTARLVGVVVAHPELKEPALNWVEENLGISARAEVESSSSGEKAARHQGANYTIKPGDTLGAIAREVLGDASKWRAIYDLNREIIGDNPDRVRVGQKLALPAAPDNSPVKSTVEKAVTEATVSDPASAAQTPAEEGANDAATTKAPTNTNPAAAAEQIAAQMGTLAQTVAAGTKAGVKQQEGQNAAAGDQKEQIDATPAGGKERFDKKGPLGPRDKVLFDHVDPLLGDFKVVLGLEGDLSAQASERYFIISSDGGLLIRTPDGMSDLVIHKVVLNLQNMAVSITSEPGIGPLEKKIITEVLRETVLQSAPQLAEEGKSPVAKALENLPTTEDGKHVAWEKTILGQSVASLLIPPNAASTVKFNKDALDIGVFPAIEFHALGFNYRIGSVRYDFATASMDIQQQASTTIMGQLGDKIKQLDLNTLELVLEKYYAEQIPVAMRTPGYDPTLDPKLNENLDTLYKNFQGISMFSKNEEQAGATPQGAGQEAAAPDSAPAQGAEQGEAAVGSADAAPDHQVLYTLKTKDFGDVEVCLDKDDSATVYKDARLVGLDSTKGIFLRIPGHEWVESVRLTEIRYNLESGTLEFEGSEKMGEFVRSILEDLVSAYVMPTLPGAATDALGVGGLSEEETHQTLYSATLEKVGKVDLLLERGDRLNMTKSAEAIDITAAQGMIVRAPSLPSLAELRISRIHYELGTGKIVIDSDNDVGPSVEKVVSLLVRQVVIPQLPGGLEGLGLAGPEQDKAVDPNKLAAYDQIVHTQDLPVLGTLEVRLAAGDTLGVAADDKTVRIYAKRGLLLVAQDVKLEMTVNELSMDFATGKVSVDASEEVGSLEQSMLTDVAKEFVMPLIKEHYKSPGNAESDNTSLFSYSSVLYRYAGGGMDIDVCLKKGSELKVEKSDEAIELSAEGGILLVSQKEGVLPENARIDRVRIDLKTKKVVIDSVPDVGELGEELATKIVQNLLAPHLPKGLSVVGITSDVQGEEKDEKEPLPDAEGIILYEVKNPHVGQLDISVASEAGVQVNSSAGSLELTADDGILLRISKLDIAVRVSRINVNLESGHVDVEASTPLGEFEQHLVDKLFEEHAGPLISKFVKTPGEGPKGPKGADVLYHYTDKKLGTFAVCVPKGGSVSVVKDEESITLRSDQGLFITGSDLLPTFTVKMVRYELHTGNFDIDVGGVSGGRYKEGQDVGDITEDVVAKLVKALVVPHVPPPKLASEIGLAGAKPGATSEHKTPKGNKLYETVVSGVGMLAIYLSKGDGVHLTRTDTEAIVESTNGLVIDLPDLDVTTRVHSIRYDLKGGDVKVDGLGSLGNAFVKHAIAEFIRPVLSAGKKDGPTSVEGLLKTLPKNSKGQAQIVESEAVDIYMMPNTHFDVLIAGNGLQLTAKPGLGIYTGKVFNYALSKLVYTFKSGGFHIDISGDNVLAKIFTPLVKSKAEGKLNQILRPNLPAAMKEADYNVMNDPELVQHLQELVANFAKSSSQKA